MHNLSTFDARTNHEQTWIHKIHHSLDLTEATIFPLIIYYVPSHGTSTQCHFVLGLPNGSPEIPKIRTLATLGAHNFACRPPIEMRYEAKLYPLLKDFQWYAARHLHARKSGRFLIFNGRESN
jgi:hypothetical protein